MTYECRITQHGDAHDVEFVAYGDLPATAGLPTAPGAAIVTGAIPVLLHVAPGRWFAPAASDEMRAQLAELATYGSAIEVEGKWNRYDLSGSGATGLLSETIDILAVLSGRDCAAVTLFDCPSWVARVDGGYIVWTRASHRLHLQAEFARLTAR